MTGDGSELGRLAIARFLSGVEPIGRAQNTIHAYTSDIDDFARYRNKDGAVSGLQPAEEARAAAVTDLLLYGPGHAEEVLNGYIRQMSPRLAQGTIQRRVSTLRTLLRSAKDAGLIDWVAELPVLKVPERDHLHIHPTYVFPHRPEEVDRLDIQHYCIRVLTGVNVLAPIKTPRRILDVGAGTGQWGFEVLEEFPEVDELVGFDLVESKRRAPARYRFVQGDALHGLPFEDGTFDLVHQRFMAVGVPLAYWPSLVTDLIRVTRPGGWVEQAEIAFGIEWEATFDEDGNERSYEAHRRPLVYAREMMRKRGLDSGSEIYSSLDQKLREHGLEEVGRREIDLKVGPWAGEIGMLMQSDVRAAVTGFIQVMQADGVLSEEEYRRIATGIEKDWEHGHMWVPVAMAWGRKPR